MSLKTLCAAAILSTASGYSNIKPPLSGKFFYADLNQAEYFGMHYVNMQLGSEKTQLHLSLSSDQSMTGVYDNACSYDFGRTLCNVPATYNPVESTTCIDNEGN